MSNCVLVLCPNRFITYLLTPINCTPSMEYLGKMVIYSFSARNWISAGVSESFKWSCSDIVIQLDSFH